MSLLRLMSNAAIMGDDVLTRGEAWWVIDRLRADDRVLWADDPPQLEAAFRAISARHDHSHKLWTDDYLAAFAQAGGSSLATLDSKLGERYPSIRVEQVIRPAM